MCICILLISENHSKNVYATALKHFHHYNWALVLGVKLRALHMLSERSTAKQHHNHRNISIVASLCKFLHGVYLANWLFNLILRIRKYFMCLCTSFRQDIFSLHLPLQKNL